MDKFFTMCSFCSGFLLSVSVAYFDHIPAGVIFLFFIPVFFINTFLKRIKPSIAFSPGELLLIGNSRNIIFWI